MNRNFRFNPFSKSFVLNTITNEEHVVKAFPSQGLTAAIQLIEVPHRELNAQGQHLSNVTVRNGNSILVETQDKTTALTSNQYRVDYDGLNSDGSLDLNTFGSGLIEVHSSLIGVTLSVSYKGTGRVAVESASAASLAESIVEANGGTFDTANTDYTEQIMSSIYRVGVDRKESPRIDEFPITSNWFRSTLPSGTLNAVYSSSNAAMSGWPELVNWLRSIKSYAHPAYGTGWDKAGSGTPIKDFSIIQAAFFQSSGLVSIYLKNDVTHQKIINAMKTYQLSFGVYPLTELGENLTIGSSNPVTVPAGEYAISEINTQNRYIVLTQTFSGSVDKTTNYSSDYPTIEVYPRRIAGSTSTARHISTAGLVFMGDGGLDAVAGLGSYDTFQGWKPFNNNYQYFNNAPLNQHHDPIPSGQGNSIGITVQGFSNAGYGTPRVGDNTKAANLAIHHFLYGGRKLNE